jgi:hypothetical protein
VGLDYRRMSIAAGLARRNQALLFCGVSGLSLLTGCGDGIDIQLGGRHFTDKTRDASAGGTGGDTDGGHLVTGGACSGLACRVDSCVGKPKTTISGTVYDPAGQVPLYNVAVYVPGDALNEIPAGVQCQTCNGFFSGRPIAVALSGSDGRFSVTDAPAGTDIPLVIQVGKWRREIKVPSVAPCADNPVDPVLTHLPSTQSEGHLPKIAIATGGSDALECLLRKIGVLDQEFTNEKGNGRVNLFYGHQSVQEVIFDEPSSMADGTPLTSADTLWGDARLLDGYDMMLLSCEGNNNVKRTDAEYKNVRRFADIGGRVFGSHWHHGWINPKAVSDPEGITETYPTVVKFSSGAHGFNPPETPITVSIDTTFQKGQAFSEWLYNVGASSTIGVIDIKGAEHSVDSVVPGVAQQWIYGTDTQNSKPMVQYLSFNTPVGAQECGRMVFSDVHVSAGTGTDSGKVPFPSGCLAKELSPQEKALEFMIFDLSSCVQPDTAPVVVPPP